MSGIEPQPREKVNVQHTFSGDLNIQNGTFERRMKIKKLLVALHDEVQALVGSTSRVDLAAHIDIEVTDLNTTRHAYRVIISEDASFGSCTTKNRPVTSSTGSGPDRSNATSATMLPEDMGSFAAAGWGERFRSVSPTSQSQALSSARGSLHSELERPNKRLRTNGSFRGGRSLDLTDRDSPPEPRTTSLVQKEIRPPVKLPDLAPSHMEPGSGSTPGDIMEFLHEWRNQWREQGGWMYDQFRALFDQEQGKKAWTEHKLDTIQNTIGSSLNFQQSHTSQELNNISKLLPWLESCRKAAADASQAREEKWRISSATFHDQARRERETAEKKIMEEVKTQKRELKKQQRMIARLLDAQGITDHVDTEDG